ncbi:hypothetical protein B9Z55_018682 [Caenorhabditis nigoni]|uniref:BPTI/Kunitz inhibitor domain-containing protein n=1 Tax=Caenorhabditis nigoni TaxID=1611254 RepID=A0A2G5TF52_9PELO|nr:hypothetical protein B9Z55_018682 [Caenorhabditis nigoni]
MSKQVFFLLAFVSLALAHPPKCYLPLSQGTDKNCGYAPSQRFHFDPVTNQCHAFQYKGCGGTMNNYETLTECAQNCDIDPKSYIQCPLGTPPVFNSHDMSDCPVSDSETGEGCESKDAYCISFPTMGLCCNRTVVDGLAEDKSAKCPSGNARWQVDGLTVLAKSCDAVTCPDGFSCKNGNFFSYCCADEVAQK